MNSIHALFTHVPELAFFLALGLGFAIGKLPLGKFRLGPVAGCIVAAVCVSQFGVTVNTTVATILFSLFIFAVGFTSGPAFFGSLKNKDRIKEIILAAALAASGLVTVVITAKLFSLDKGLAAGVAAGALTQSAILGSAETAFAGLAIAPDEIARFAADISAGYGVTYILGAFIAIAFCAYGIESFTGKSIRDDAVAEEAKASTGLIVASGQELAVPRLIGRIFPAGASAGKSVEQFENAFGSEPVTIERIKRAGKMLPVRPGIILQADDILLIIGKRNAVLEASKVLGNEIPRESGMDVVIKNSNIVVTNNALFGKTLQDIIDATSAAMRHGLYLTAIHRGGLPLDISPETRLERGDIITLFGAATDVARVEKSIGNALTVGQKTGFVYIGLGLVAGLLLGELAVHVGGVSFTLGSGGGVLLSGLFFGWLRSRHTRFGALPEGAAQLMKDLGLAGFVCIIGLNYGMRAVSTVAEHGVAILLAGCLVSVLPLALTMLIGKYALRYDNTAIFAGALAGAHSSNPAFGEVLTKAGNTVPTTAFVVTYAFANVFLTLLGPLIVALI